MLDEARAHPSSPAPLAALDWDDTCFHGDISESALAHLQSQTDAPLVSEYEEQCRSDLRAAYVGLVHTLVAGRTPDEVTALAEATLAEALASGRIRWRPCMNELVRGLFDSGFEVCVITASPEGLVRPLAARLGIPEHAVIGMRSALDVDGRYLPRLAAPPTHFEGKLAALRSQHGRGPVFAAGDSESDAPMMQSARYALLLDRGQPALQARAAARRWFTHHGERDR